MSYVCKRLHLLLLAVAFAVVLVPAILASRIDPPGNDLALHGVMVEGAAEALRQDGWNTFQDPWFPRPNGGYAIFHSYPHLVDQTLAFCCVISGADPWAVLGAGGLLAVLLLPFLAYLGGRSLGLSRPGAAVGALMVATMRSADPYGHGPLCYGFDSHGLYGQVWGMGMASWAFGAWIAAAHPGGAGLARLSSPARMLLAALLVAVIVRTHYPTGWVLCLVTAVAVVAWGPARELPGRLLRFAAVGAVAGVLAAGFLVPFISDLDSLVTQTIEHPWKMRSIGAVAVLRRLAVGDYLDGAGPGPWTLLLLLALGWTALRWGRLRTSPPVLGGLAVAIVFAIGLLFGRETWGDWVERVPVVGRFHDHRYLLGLHLLAPFLVAAAVEDLWPRISERFTIARFAVAGSLVVFAVAAQGMATADDWRLWRETRPRFEVFASDIEPLVQRALGRPRERLALGFEDVDRGGTTAMWWLRRRSVNTAGRPLHQFAAVRDLLVFWEAWVTDSSGMRARSIDSLDLRPLGIDGLAAPDGDDPLGHPWGLRRVDIDGSTLDLLVPEPDPGVVGDVALVRSDLLVQAERLDLQGFSIAWFLAGLHRGAQYPTIDVGLGPPPPVVEYQRVIRLADQDTSAFGGLPKTSHAALGHVLSVDLGDRPAERIVTTEVIGEGAWLRLAHSWHPQWRASVDGEPAHTYMLTPGFLGVRLSPGTHTVSAWWHVPPWRGPWATLNAVFYLLSGFWIVVCWLRGRRRAAQAL